MKEILIGLLEYAPKEMQQKATEILSTDRLDHAESDDEEDEGAVNEPEHDDGLTLAELSKMIPIERDYDHESEYEEDGVMYVTTKYKSANEESAHSEADEEEELKPPKHKKEKPKSTVKEDKPKSKPEEPKQADDEGEETPTYVTDDDKKFARMMAKTYDRT
ncbi:hypothetical protein BGZ91_005649 [Linnemannia elongata]|nr:hypothetical protein BGZ91_005649 [Linnemannia elongata]